MPEAPRRARGRQWLTDTRGRRYRKPYARHGAATHFRVLYQSQEGALWRTILRSDASPQVLPLDLTRAEFLAIAAEPGGYQLIPVDDGGIQRGDPPQRLDVRPGPEIAPLPTAELIARRRPNKPVLVPAVLATAHPHLPLDAAPPDPTKPLRFRLRRQR